MTVGEDLDGNIGYLQSTEIGSINPSFFVSEEEISSLYYSDTEFYKSVIFEITIDRNSALESFTEVVISINGTEYTTTTDELGDVFINLTSNPFPPVGETCEIKLRYTLA